MKLGVFLYPQQELGSLLYPHVDAAVVQTSPGRKQDKRSPIVKLSKEQPAPPSITGTSVPVPSGQSWVREDTQKYMWTKWRIILAVSTVFVIAIALLVAFSHPSSRVYQSHLSGVLQGIQTSHQIPLPVLEALDSWQAALSKLPCSMSGSGQVLLLMLLVS